MVQTANAQIPALRTVSMLQSPYKVTMSSLSEVVIELPAFKRDFSLRVSGRPLTIEPVLDELPVLVVTLSAPLFRLSKTSKPPSLYSFVWS